MARRSIDEQIEALEAKRAAGITRLRGRDHLNLARKALGQRKDQEALSELNKALRCTLMLVGATAEQVDALTDPVEGLITKLELSVAPAELPAG